jgi:hypothetical protein
LNIYDDALAELQRRHVEDVDVFGPYFVISYACHAFNLMNEESLKNTDGRKAVYMVSGQLPNMRNHLLFMAPPGTGKSFFLRHFSNKNFGIFRHGGHPMHTETSITEAGLIGTIKLEPDGSATTVPGAASEHRTSIFVIEEFLAMMKAMSTGYNAQLEAQLLMGLDSGDVSKRLAHGNIDYHTSLSMWCGIQPIKVSLEGGLGRRFCYLLNIPSTKDQERYAESSMGADNIDVDMEWLRGYWRRVELWTASLDLIQSVKFDPAFYNFLRTVIKCKGHEVDIYRRLILGYHLSKYGASEHVVVTLDETITKLIIQQAEWRHRIKQGPRVQQLIYVLRENGRQMESGFGMTKAEMISFGSDMELSAQLVHEILLDAAKLGYIKMRGNNLCLEPAALLDSPIIQRAKDAGLVSSTDDSDVPEIKPTVNKIMQPKSFEMDYDTLNEKEWDDLDLYEMEDLRDYAEERNSNYQ